MSKTANIIFASRLTEPIMAALTTEVTYVKSEMMRSLHVVHITVANVSNRRFM